MHQLLAIINDRDITHHMPQIYSEACSCKLNELAAWLEKMTSADLKNLRSNNWILYYQFDDNNITINKET